jgi:site-specific DNA-methyltransferase (adenine-specific)
MLRKKLIGEYYNIDCMELMARYPDKYFDLAIVDPPYGIGEDGSNNHTRGKLANAKNYKSFYGNDKKTESKEYFLELKRISKNQIIWGANHFIDNIRNANSSCWVIWDKNNGMNDFADCELAWTSFKSAVRKFKFTWNGMLQEDMENKEIRIHPTQKPVKLYEWLLQNYAKPNDLILDTHVGSASSLVACENMGFKYVGCELDKDYYEASMKRLNDYLAQQKLFMGNE